MQSLENQSSYREFINSNNIKICSKCALPVSSLGLSTDRDGSCDICSYFNAKNKFDEPLQNIRSFKKLIKLVKNNNREFDCIVPVSGGKDSIYTLYLCVKSLGLKVLAVHVDNGFVTDSAKYNIKNAVSKLKVPFKRVIIPKSINQQLYKHFLQRIGNFCLVCNMGINASLYRIAYREKIPYIFYGYSQKYEYTPIFGGKRYCREEIFKKIALEKFSIREIRPFLLKPILKKYFIEPICFLSLIEYNPKYAIGKLKKELGWRTEEGREEKVDCALYDLANYLKDKKFGASRQILIDANLVRNGLKHREDILDKSVSIRKPKNLNELIKTIAATEEDLNFSGSTLDFVETKSIKQILNGVIFNEHEETETKIEKIINFIRPDIVKDGGDIDLINFNKTKNEVIIRAKEDCKGCPMSRMVLRNYLEFILFKYLSKFIKVEIIY